MRHLFILFFLILSTSCSTKRQSMKTQQQKEITSGVVTQSAARETAGSSSDLKKQSGTDRINETKTHQVEYDTDKPILQSTGKPPIKSETMTTVKTSEQVTATEISSAKDTVSRQTDLLSDEFIKASETELNVATKTAKKTNFLPILLMVSVSIALVIAAWYLKKQGVLGRFIKWLSRILRLL